MATVKVTFYAAERFAADQSAMPAPFLGSATTQYVTSSDTSATTTATSTAPQGFGFARIESDGAVYAVNGADPTAVEASGTAQPGFPISANTPLDFRVNNGDKIAVIDQA